MTAKRPQFRLFDFQVSEHREEIYDKYGNIDSTNRTFLVKMFGMNTKGKTYCIFAKNFIAVVNSICELSTQIDTNGAIAMIGVTCKTTVIGIMERSINLEK